MADFEFNPETFDDRKIFVRAASVLSRADEAARRTDAFSGAIVRRHLRAEAVAIAGLEGHAVRTEALCRLIGNRDTTHLDRGTKLAADLYYALELSAKWGDGVPDAEAVLELFTVSDASSGRLMRPDLVWSLEEDASWLVQEMASLAEAPDPWAALDVVRRIWTSGRFQSCARRMAMLTAPWVIAKGFELHEQAYGLAQRARARIDSFKDAGRIQDTWSMVAGAAVAEAGEAALRLVDDHRAERAALLAICPPERTSSSVYAAVDFVMGTPVFTVKGLCDALDLTPRGAKVVLDKMEDAGLLEVEGGSRNRNYVCRRTL
jgi:hypothetical protein